MLPQVIASLSRDWLRCCAFLFVGSQALGRLSSLQGQRVLTSQMDGSVAYVLLGCSGDLFIGAKVFFQRCALALATQLRRCC